MVWQTMRTLFALAFVLGTLVPASAQTLRCRFGPGATPASPERLWFSAGIDDESHGLLGTLEPAP